MPLEHTDTNRSADEEFIQALYEKYGARMYAAACKQISDPVIAEDIVQDSIVKLIKKVSTLRALQDHALTAYIIFTVKNTAICYHRKRSVRDRLTSELSPEQTELTAEPYQSEPEARLLAAEEKARFRQAFSLLPKQERDLLTEKYFLGASDKEIATVFGCKPGSVRMRLTRARRHMYELMKEVNGHHDECEKTAEEK